MADSNLKTLIVCISKHHGNTLKVASAMTEAIGADLVSPAEFSAELASRYDVLGFGSGVYHHELDPKLLEIIDWLPQGENKPVFVFSTSAFGFKAPHKTIKSKLSDKNYQLTAEFSCPGKDTYRYAKLFFGGFSRRRPNARDLDAAAVFAKKMITGITLKLAKK